MANSESIGRAAQTNQPLTASRSATASSAIRLTDTPTLTPSNTRVPQHKASASDIHVTALSRLCNFALNQLFRSPGCQRTIDQIPTRETDCTGNRCGVGMGFGWVLQPSVSSSMTTRLPMASRFNSTCKSIGNVDGGGGGGGGLVGLAAIGTKPAPAPPPPQQQQQPERRVAITRCVTPERFLGAGIAHPT